MISYPDLSRTVSHALRHEPSSYGLVLDADGWVGNNILGKLAEGGGVSLSYLVYASLRFSLPERQGRRRLVDDRLLFS